MKISFKPYAIDAIKWVLLHPACGLLLPPGLGKTAITLYAFNELKKAGIVDTLFVIAPIRVATIVWPDEVNKWDDFSHLSIGVLQGPNKDKVLMEEHDIYSMNIESLLWFLNKTKGKIPEKTMLVCDESTLFKNHSTERFKKFKKIAPKFSRRVILTGTPVPNGLIQLWPQVFLLDQGKRLSRYITQFRNAYFYTSVYDQYNFQLIPGGEEKIYKAVDDIIMHKSQNELDLPPLVYNVINVEMPDKAMQVYKELKDDFFIELDDQPITAINSAVLGGKLKQISNGHLYTNSMTKDYTCIHDEKIKAIESLLNDLAGRPLLVVYEFLHDLDRLKSNFDAPHIGGGVKPNEANKIIKDWNLGKLPLLYLHPQAGGHGLNLQDGGCHDIVWFSITFDLELYEQTIKRVHRQGVKNSVTVHHIVCKNTIDMKIMKALSNKSNVQDALLEALLK